MELVIITGLSGAGKATVAKIFEDLAYTVVDNLPPPLLLGYLDTFAAKDNSLQEQKVAVVMDARAGASFHELTATLQQIAGKGIRPTVLFLDSTEAALVQRFKETRRRHPLSDEDNGILSSIRAERTLLDSLRDQSDKVIDTSDLSVHDLRDLILREFANGTEKNQGLALTLTSFGFKYGLPLDADLVFDVRFLTNPHYVDELRPLDGRDSCVQEYIATDAAFSPYMEKVLDLLSFSIPHYIAEGKAYLTVAFGCTGGRHRSVMVSEKLAESLRSLGYHISVQHRDVQK